MPEIGEVPKVEEFVAEIPDVPDIGAVIPEINEVESVESVANGVFDLADSTLNNFKIDNIVTPSTP